MKLYSVIISGGLIVSFLLQLVIPGYTDAFVLNSKAYYEPWRFVTSIFLHSGITHLIYNLFALILFGLIFEKITSSNKFILVFFVTGVVANLIAVNFYPSSLGASGAIFGIIGAVTIIRPFIIIWAFGLPMPIIVATFLWAAGDILYTFIPTNVGTIAHLSGLFAGLTLGIFFRKKTVVTKTAPVRISEEYMLSWEDHYLK